MKKLFLFGILTFAAMGLYSNPNPPPEVHINEFRFINLSYNWQIELIFAYSDAYSYDSITVRSLTGVSRVASFSYGSEYYFPDWDLANPISINPMGDIITVTAYHPVYGAITCSVAFGNVSDPYLTAPLIGQSIERFEPTNFIFPYTEIFSLSNHPTIGLPNDTTGTFGTMHGTIFDVNGNPVADQQFYVDHPFTTNSVGQYSTRIYSRIFSWDTISYEKWSGHFSPVQIAPISYTMIPDSGITRDIHLLSELLTGIPPGPKKAGQALTIFPNPVMHMITVSYGAGLSAAAGDLHIDIYDMNGKKMVTSTLENQLGVVNIPVNLLNGMYIAVLSGQEKNIGSARFIVNIAE